MEIKPRPNKPGSHRPPCPHQGDRGGICRGARRPEQPLGEAEPPVPGTRKWQGSPIRGNPQTGCLGPTWGRRALEDGSAVRGAPGPTTGPPWVGPHPQPCSPPRPEPSFCLQGQSPQLLPARGPWNSPSSRCSGWTHQPAALRLRRRVGNSGSEAWRGSRGHPHGGGAQAQRYHHE